MIILDLIESLPIDDPAQMHAREWARRARELHERQTELREKALDAFDAGDEAACMSAVAEHDATAAELAEVNSKLRKFMSRLHPAPETTQ